MIKKYALIISLISFFFMVSGCVNTGYSTRSRGPVDSSARLPVKRTNGPPPHSYERKIPPPWAPAHGHRAKYNYRYYPSSEVYFDTGRRLYFWYRNGSWSASVSLPGGIRVRVNDYVTLEMDSDRPYIHHVDVIKKYPPKRNIKKKRTAVYRPSPSKNQGPPPWAPAHGQRAKYSYRYYPSSQVYFDTGRGLYFCYRNGSWSASAYLPGDIKISVDDYVTLEMNSDRPYLHHGDVKKKYPPEKQKKIKEEKVEKKNKNKDKQRGKYEDKYKNRGGDRYK